MLQGFNRSPFTRQVFTGILLWLDSCVTPSACPGRIDFFPVEEGRSCKRKRNVAGTVRPGYSRRFQDIKLTSSHGHNVAQLLSLADMALCNLVVDVTHRCRDIFMGPS